MTILLNTITVLIAYGLTVWFFWSSIRKGKWSPVAPTPEILTMMVIKLFTLYSLLWLFCWYCEVIAISVLLIIGIPILVLLYTLPELAAPVLVVGYVLFQWILGFPDKELWIPPNKRYKQNSNLPDSLLGKIGITKTPLRPTGYIIVDDIEHLAKSEFDFLDKDTPVEIKYIANRTLIVNHIECINS